MSRLSKYLIIVALIVGIGMVAFINYYRSSIDACECSCKKCTCSITKASKEKCLCGCENCK